MKRPLRLSSSTAPLTPMPAREQIEAAGLFQHGDVRLFQDPVAQVRHDLDAGEIAFVNRAVERLAGERLLVDRAVGVAVEQAADAVFELDDAVGRIGHQAPRPAPDC